MTLSATTPSPSRGLFLVLEGGEGAGKSTQARFLAEWLEERGIRCRLSREPGGTPVGEEIRRVLLEHRELAIPSETELLLMLAARAAFVRNVVTPALESGKVMIADRFEYSTFVYQGVARGLGVEEVRKLNFFATGGVTPDLTVVLDVSSSVGTERQRREGKERDRIEGEGGGFLERVRMGYRALAEDDPRAEVVEGGGKPEEVFETIVRILQARFPELFAPTTG